MQAKVILLSLCAVLAGCSGHSPNGASIKPGLWEMQITKMEMDGKDMLAQMQQAMAKIPPEQREKMGMAADPTAPRRLCITPEMAKRAESFMPPRLPSVNGCPQPKLDRSGNRITFEMTCNGTSMTGQTVLDGNQISSTADMVVTMGGAKRTTHQESQMSFVSSDCGDIKPLDAARK